MANAPIRNPFSALEVRSDDEEQAFESKKNMTSTQVFILTGPTASSGVKKKKKIRPEEKKKLEEEKLKKQKQEKAESKKAEKKNEIDNKIEQEQHIEQIEASENNNYQELDYSTNNAYNNGDNNYYYNYDNNYNYYSEKSESLGNKGYNKGRYNYRNKYKQQQDYVIKEREFNDNGVVIEKALVVENGIHFAFINSNNLII